MKLCIANIYAEISPCQASYFDTRLPIAVAIEESKVICTEAPLFGTKNVGLRLDHVLIQKWALKCPFGRRKSVNTLSLTKIVNFKPAASQRTMASLVVLVTPPRWPPLGEGRM
jgi:hypothetical protein